uniref:Uncharacterized protein n=1 Tax=Arundo donax TaxID=35708 RepID=A0A0A8YT37_ARUDO
MQCSGSQEGAVASLTRRGMYVSILEKALKKERDDELHREATAKRDRMGAGASSSGADNDAGPSTSTPPNLTIEQLLKLGEDCGFGEKEEGEILEATRQGQDE